MINFEISIPIQSLITQLDDNNVTTTTTIASYLDALILSQQLTNHQSDSSTSTNTNHHITTPYTCHLYIPNILNRRIYNLHTMQWRHLLEEYPIGSIQSQLSQEAAAASINICFHDAPMSMQAITGQSPSTLPQLHVAPKCILAGGKGGFGALLKGRRAREMFNKVTDRSACRTLQGRRVRTEGQEEQVQEWRERQERLRQETEERERRETAQKYEKLKEELLGEMMEDQKVVSESVSEAIQRVMKEKKKMSRRNGKTAAGKTTTTTTTTTVTSEGDEESREAPANGKLRAGSSSEEESPSNDVPDVSATKSKKRKRKKKSLFDEDDLFGVSNKKKKKRKKGE